MMGLPPELKSSLGPYLVSELVVRELTGELCADNAEEPGRFRLERAIAGRRASGEQHS